MSTTNFEARVTVSETSKQKADREDRKSQGRPAHRTSDNPNQGFRNPWPSWKDNGYTEVAQILPELPVTWLNRHTLPPDLSSKFPLQKPTFGLARETSPESIKVTWLGHACFLVELPRRSDDLVRGPRILFDPVFSERCSPSQFIGPKRYTPMPCAVEDIPDVDIVVISHNHYDHLDTYTIKTLFKRLNPPHIFLPLGNGPYLRSIEVPESHSHLLDWWDSQRITVDIPRAGDGNWSFAFDITCTPAQHFTGRGLLDRFATLWAGWAVNEIVDTESLPAGSREPVKVYFAGDTGYRTVKDGEDEESVPVCPAFKEIGNKFDGFDFAMIPIGAYHPRWFMSSFHCAPQDSVRIFQDVRAKKALGMHWGTWMLTTEDVTEPPTKLKNELSKLDIDDSRFGVCDIGETTLW